jgi:hypothetical protein
MRELRENENVKKEAQDKGISKGEMQVWLSKKGGETWAVMSAEEKKVRSLERDCIAHLNLGYLLAYTSVDISRNTTTGLPRSDQTMTPGRQSKFEATSKRARTCSSHVHYRPFEVPSSCLFTCNIRFMPS